MTTRPTAEKFFSPQKNFRSNFHSKAQNFTPNLTHNSNNAEKNQNKISISSILPQKNQEQSINDHTSKTRISDLIKTYASNNDNYEQNNQIKNENNLNLMFKEWKIKKTNEMIERFEGQMQILLKENEKLMLNSKQKQQEIERLKASAFANNCKIKELESKNDIMKEELDHSFNLLREKEEDIEMWKSKFFESEQKVSVLDSLEYKAMENEYLLMEYQRKIDEMAEENEKIKNFKEFTNDLNDQFTAIVEEIDNLCKIIENPNETKKNIPSNDFLLNMSFQTPEKIKQANPLEHIQSQLKLIGSFLEISKNDSPNKEKIIKKLEKELENEKKEKIALNSKIIFLRNAKSKDNKDNDKAKNVEIENEIAILKTELEKKNQLYNELNFKLENSYTENESLKNNQELLRSEILSLQNNRLIPSQEINNEIEHLKNELINKKREIEELEIINQEKERKLLDDQANYEQDLKQIVNECEHKLTESLEANKKLSELMNENQRKNEEFIRENNKLKINSQNLEIEIKKKDQIIQEINEKNVKAEQVLNQEIRRLKTLVEKPSDNNNNNTQDDKDSAKFLELLEKYTHLEQTHFQLQNSYQQNLQVISEKENEIQTLKNIYLRNNKNNEMNDQENDNLKLENEQLLLKIRDFERNIENFARENQRLKEDLLLGNQTIQNLKSKLSEDQQNGALFQQKIESLSKEVSDLLGKNEILSNKANELNEIIDKKNKIDLMNENENSSLQGKNHELAYANEELSHKLQLHIEEINRKNEEISQIQNLLNEKEILFTNKLKNNNNSENLLKNKEELENEKNDLLNVVQKLKEQLLESQKNSQFFSDSLDKARKETRLLFFLAVVVIICISLFFFMN